MSLRGSDDGAAQGVRLELKNRGPGADPVVLVVIDRDEALFFSNCLAMIAAAEGGSGPSWESASGLQLNSKSVQEVAKQLFSCVARGCVTP